LEFPYFRIDAHGFPPVNVNCIDPAERGPEADQRIRHIRRKRVARLSMSSIDSLPSFSRLKASTLKDATTLP
jgi:hypothetical protein